MSIVQDDGTIKDEGDAIQADVISAPGVVVADNFGNSWTIPADEHEDLTDLGAGSIFDRFKHDDRFTYNLIQENRVAQRRLEGWVVVSKEEVGLSNDLVLEYGKPVTSDVHIMDGVYMKIPKQIADRRLKRKAEYAKQVVEQTEPTDEMLKRARRGQSPTMKKLQETIDAARADGLHMEQNRKRRISDKLTA